MTRSLPFALLATASMLSGAAAFAAQTPAPSPAKPVAKTATVATRTVKKTTITTTRAPRMVTTKLANGKSATYDCSKPGNAAKKICKS